MKQQVNPVVAIVAGVVTIAVVGLIYYFISSRSGATTPTKTISTPAPLKGGSPDQQMRMRMQQMQQGGSGGQ